MINAISFITEFEMLAHEMCSHNLPCSHSLQQLYASMRNVLAQLPSRQSSQPNVPAQFPSKFTMNYCVLCEVLPIKRCWPFRPSGSEPCFNFTMGMNLCERVGEKGKQEQTKDVKRQGETPNDQSRWAVDRQRTDIRDEDARDSLARGGLAV